MAKIDFPYFVEYIDENGELQYEHWNQQTMDKELRRGAVNITHIELSYRAQIELGMIEDEDDEELDDWEPADIDSDCGFDPYMGCFSDDC